MKKSLQSLLVLFPLFASCVGPAIAEDLLREVERQEQPLAAAAPAIAVSLNPDINNAEGLDASVEQSLTIALDNANLFGEGVGGGYRIDADIVTASMSTMSFGSFEGKFDVHYVVHDASGRKVFDETVKTVAGSDQWSFAGAARHRRSRAVQMAKNVLTFVDLLVAKVRG
jgi:hypothetical protein